MAIASSTQVGQRYTRFGMLLIIGIGNTHINELLACFFTLVGKEPDACGNGRMNHDHLRVRLDFLHQIIAEDCAVRFSVTPVDDAGRDVKVGGPVETFLRVFGEAVAFALERVDVNDHGLRGILHLPESRNKRFDVATLFYIQVIEPSPITAMTLPCSPKTSRAVASPSAKLTEVEVWPIIKWSYIFQ